MAFNLHPRPTYTLKCEHGECWKRVPTYATQCVKLCREHGVWALCDAHADQIRAEHAGCTLGMRYTLEEYAALA